jgi:hypothetical protein
MEWLSEMNSFLIGEGTSSEAFTNSLVMTLKLQSNKDESFKLTTDVKNFPK